MRLQGRIAIVTGAASGIGRAIAARFAREGARVVLGDVDEPGGRQAAAQICAGAGTRCSSPATWRSMRTRSTWPPRPWTLSAASTSW